VPSAAELHLQEHVRKGEDGQYYVGTDPWFDCSVCGVVFDTAEHDSCPACWAYYHFRRRQRAAAEAMDRAADTGTRH
jgi:hypothetical protein